MAALSHGRRLSASWAASRVKALTRETNRPRASIASERPGGRGLAQWMGLPLLRAWREIWQASQSIRPKGSQASPLNDFKILVSIRDFRLKSGGPRGCPGAKMVPRPRVENGAGEEDATFLCLAGGDPHLRGLGCDSSRRILASPAGDADAHQREAVAKDVRLAGDRALPGSSPTCRRRSRSASSRSPILIASSSISPRSASRCLRGSFRGRGLVTGYHFWAVRAGQVAHRHRYGGPFLDG